MTDLRDRFAELDYVEVPDLRDRVDAFLETGGRLVVAEPAAGRALRRVAPAALLAVFVSTLVVMGGLIWALRGSSGEQGPADSDEPAPVTTVAQPPPSAVPGPASIPDEPFAPDRFDIAEWQEVPLNPTTFGAGAQIRGFSDTAGGTFAFGYADGAALWHSTDGVEWARITHDFGSGAAITDLSASGFGMVAVGIDWSGDRPVAAAWTSVGGVEWVRVPHDADVFAGATARINAVTSGSFGLVAVGQACEADPGPCPGRPAFWLSPDGSSWRRVLLDDVGSVLDVTIGGPGLVAVGTVGDGAQDAAVWVSSDALSWTRIESDGFGGEGNQWMARVAALPTIVVAVGGEWTEATGPRSMVWNSVDGMAWDLESGTGAIAAGPLNGIAAGGPGFVAAGDESLGSPDTLWSSPDGLSWTPATGRFTDLFSDLADVATTGFGLLTTDGGHIWMTPPAAMPTQPEPDVDWEALFGLTTEAVQMTDGWTRLGFDPEVFGDAEVHTGAAAVGPAGIAVLGRSGAESIAWVSPDGLDWVRTGLGDVVSGSTRFFRMVAGDAGYVAIGGQNSAYFSRDGLSWRRVQIAEDRGAEISDLVTWNETFVAAGFDTRAGKHVTVWTSVNGVDFSVAYTDETAMVDPCMNCVLLSASEEAILVTAIETPEASPQFSVWLSSDGVSYTKTLGLPGLCPDPEAADPMMASPGGLAVVCGATGVLYVSEDGASWEEAPPFESSSSGRRFDLVFAAIDQSEYDWIETTGVSDVFGREVSLGSFCLRSEAVCAVAVLVRE